MSRKFVIDTSIAKSAGGEEATHPTPTHCREFLKAIRENNYFLVFTPDIAEEWHKHRSKFTHKWLTSMYARRLVANEPVAVAELVALRQKTLNCCSTEKIREAVDKDWRLVEAALNCDKTIASLDDTMRGYLQNVAQTISQLQPLFWANPHFQHQAVMNWLENGATDRDGVQFLLL